MHDLFGALDLQWVLRQLTGGNPVPFALWSAFAVSAGFALGAWWRGRSERARIDDRLGRVPEFSRVRTLDDLISKADELAKSASAEVMVERTARIAELEAKVAKLALQLDEKSAEAARLSELAESGGALDADRLREENADLRRDLISATSSAWYAKSREETSRRQARARFARLAPPEADAVMRLYASGPVAADSIDSRMLSALTGKKAAEVRPENLIDEVPTACLSGRMASDLNSYMDEFESLFGERQ